MAYTEDQKADALALLAANDGNVNLTARKLGLPESTIRLWKGKMNGVIGAKCEEKKRALADKLEGLVEHCADILPGKLIDASARDTAVTLGIAAEKMQLLRGEPTASVHSSGDNEAERAARIAAIMEAAKGRPAGSTDK